MLAHAAQKNGGGKKRLGALEPYQNEGEMVKALKEALGGSGKGTRALVIGALGRCGSGAVDLLRKVGLDEYVFSCSLEFLTSYFQTFRFLLNWLFY